MDSLRQDTGMFQHEITREQIRCRPIIDPKQDLERIDMYSLLTKHFFKATLRGQILSLWKKRHDEARLEQYRTALRSGHVAITRRLTKREAYRLETMQVPIPPEFAPVSKSKQKKTISDPDAVRLSHRQVERLQSLGVKCPPEMLPLRRKKTSRKELS